MTKCPSCGLGFQKHDDFDDLAGHFVAEARRSDAGHVMWLNRNITKNKSDGKTLAKLNYARYYSQLGNGNIAGTINPVGSTTLRYPWMDLNGDRVAQVTVVLSAGHPIADHRR